MTQLLDFGTQSFIFTQSGNAKNKERKVCLVRVLFEEEKITFCIWGNTKFQVCKHTLAA